MKVNWWRYLDISTEYPRSAHYLTTQNRQSGHPWIITNSVFPASKSPSMDQYKPSCNIHDLTTKGHIQSTPYTEYRSTNLIACHQTIYRVHLQTQEPLRVCHQSSFAGLNDSYKRDSYGRMSLDQPENNRFLFLLHSPTTTMTKDLVSQTQQSIVDPRWPVSRASTSTSPMNKPTPASAMAKPL